MSGRGSELSDWPFVGRSDELCDGLAAVRPGSAYGGVVFCGVAGVGKTTLARAVADQLGPDGWMVQSVLGTETGRAVPLGAFHRALEVVDAHEPAVMLASAYRTLAGEKDVVTVVDDAQYLDPLSALLVHQLAMSGSARLVVTIRSGEPTPDAVTALWKDDLLLRIDVRPFTHCQTTELVAQVLGGDIDDRLVEQLHQLSDGSPLILRGLLVAGRADGVVCERDGRWCLSGRLRAGPDLTELVESRIATLDPDEVDVIEYVSTAEVLEWEVLRALCDAGAVSRVERRGLIHFVTDAAYTLVQPGHPIVGEVVRRRCGVARAREINTALAQQLSDHLRGVSDRPHGSGHDVRARIRLARMMIESDISPDPQAIVQAAESAVTMANLELGEELARFVFDRGGDVSAAIVLADAVSWQGRGAEAESILSAYNPDGTDGLMCVRWGCLRAANLFFGCGDADAAQTVLASVRGHVRSDAMLSLVTAMQAAVAFFGADLSTAVTAGRAALREDAMPMAGVWAALATAGALALSGRFEEVGAIAERGLRAAASCESGPQRYALGMAEVMALIGFGDLDAAQRVCERYEGMTAGVPQAQAIVTALAGRVDFVRGSAVLACEALRKSVWTMSESLPVGWVMLVAAWLAQAAGARGDAETARVALARAEKATGPQVAVFLPELELARSWVQAAAGQTTSARSHANRAAKTARRAGMHAVEANALHTAVRFGDRSQSVRLAALAAQLDSPLPTAMAEHGRGLAEHDGERLSAASDQFYRIGAWAMAADAAAHASREYARSGNRIPELEASTRAHWLASRCDVRTPAVEEIERPLPITDREREIANLVGACLTNREIADRLGVSPRTVDGHLYRIFAKLGIEDRDQLARLIGNPPRNWGSRLP